MENFSSGLAWLITHDLLLFIKVARVSSEEMSHFSRHTGWCQMKLLVFKTNKDFFFHCFDSFFGAVSQSKKINENL